MQSATHRPEDVLEFDWSGVVRDRITPQTYRGLFAFHKYWGKKPVELVSAIVGQLSDPGDLVVDPFLGSGAIARESHRLGRRFAGTDLNPLAAELTRFTCELPDVAQYDYAVKRLTERVRPLVSQMYALEDGGTATHYLWDGSALRSVWTYPNGPRNREERVPTQHDLDLSSSTNDYRVRNMRPLVIKQNARINSLDGMVWHDFFSGRALAVMEEILDFAESEPDFAVRRALRLTLTSAMGQMSKMVFALEKKGLAKGEVASSISVGSWAIGLWRPETHFEVNAWSCFQVRSKKLANSLKKMTALERQSVETGRLESADLSAPGTVIVDNRDALRWLKDLPDGSVKLVVTDPPHGDRIPYLELSELWNAALGFSSDLESELVVSNAPGRLKGVREYFDSLSAVFGTIKSKLMANGHVALMYNSTSADDWQDLRTVVEHAGLKIDGVASADYSVGSLVQDNRSGALKSDVVVLISHEDQPSSAEIQKIIAGNQHGGE